MALADQSGACPLSLTIRNRARRIPTKLIHIHARRCGNTEAPAWTMPSGIQRETNLSGSCFLGQCPTEPCAAHSRNPKKSLWLFSQASRQAPESTRPPTPHPPPPTPTHSRRLHCRGARETTGHAQQHHYKCLAQDMDRLTWLLQGTLSRKIRQLSVGSIRKTIDVQKSERLKIQPSSNQADAFLAQTPTSSRQCLMEPW